MSVFVIGLNGCSEGSRNAGASSKSADDSAESTPAANTVTGTVSYVSASVPSGTSSTQVIVASGATISASAPAIAVPPVVTVSVAPGAAQTPVIALSLSGTPAARVVVGSTYDFSPTVTSAAGVRLVYTIQNKPGWANFDSGSGELRGTPSGAAVGNNSAIVITVSDGVTTAKLAPFAVSVMQSGSDSITVDATTLRGQVIAGYQGWFTCPDDKTGSGGWGHWLNSDGTPAVDMVPDTSALPQQAGCLAPFIRDVKGNPVRLYSAQNPATVDAQFKSLQDQNISGVALQRFVSELAKPILKEGRDQVLTNVRLAASKHSRVFFITYDISGAGPNWAVAVKQDWQALVKAHVIDGLGYLHHAGKPVVEIWGIGFSDRPANPTQTLDLMKFFTENADAQLRASVIAGVPVSWREMTEHDGDAPSWMDAYQLASSISPWFVGAFTDEASELLLIRQHILGDLALTQANGQVYLPVIYPGFSSFNQSRMTQKFEKRPRACGQFLTLQTSDLLQVGISSFYVAMFDEANEGTAVFTTRFEPFSSSAGEARFMDSTPGCENEGSLYLGLLGDLSTRVKSL